MRISLPEPFLRRMQAMLEGEYDSFLAAYDEPRAYGLRVNTLKISVPDFMSLTPFPLEKVEWCDGGFYYPEGERPGKHPFYHAGLYYIQEPSAMAPAELLGVVPGDRVLDLCAAPGGKSTQLAAKLQGEGILVVNDNNAQRVKALVKNIELFGVRNAVVLNELPERMKRAFAGFFNKILIDAPCSGEGMFRKEPEMTGEWGRHSVEVCMAMQRDIMSHAADMLAPGGTIVYSTCTFAPEENEGTIARFLTEHPEFETVTVPHAGGITGGRPDWVTAFTAQGQELPADVVGAVADTGRLWPHKLRGEGHFVAVLRKKGTEMQLPFISGQDGAPRSTFMSAASDKPGGGARGGRPGKAGKGDSRAGKTTVVNLEPWHQFVRDLLLFAPHGVPVLFGEHLYVAPEGLPDLSGIRVIRPGWYVGRLPGGRFEPSHALAMGLRAGEVVQAIHFTIKDPRSLRYLKGETLEAAKEEITLTGSAVPAKGYVLICIEGYPVGWGKWQNGMLKNEYPPGWRWQ